MYKYVFFDLGIAVFGGEVRDGDLEFFGVVDLPREHRVIGGALVRGIDRGIFDFRHRKLQVVGLEEFGFMNDHTRIESCPADLILPRDGILDPLHDLRGGSSFFQLLYHLLDSN